MFVLSQSVYPWQAFPAYTNVGKANILPQSGALEKCFIQGRLQPYLKTLYQAGKPFQDKHSSLIQAFVNYSRKELHYGRLQSSPQILGQGERDKQSSLLRCIIITSSKGFIAQGRGCFHDELFIHQFLLPSFRASI